jgi:hypothetical protein
MDVVRVQIRGVGGERELAHWIVLEEDAIKLRRCLYALPKPATRELAPSWAYSKHCHYKNSLAQVFQDLRARSDEH